MKGSEFVKIMKTNNDILVNSKYQIKSSSLHSHAANPKLSRRNFQLRQKAGFKLDESPKTRLEDTDDFIKEISNSSTEIQPFLPFLNQKKRRDALSTIKKHNIHKDMFKTADLNGHNDLTIEEKTNPTSDTVHEKVIFKPSRHRQDAVQTHNNFLDSSVSNCSKFFDEF